MANKTRVRHPKYIYTYCSRLSPSPALYYCSTELINTLIQYFNYPTNYGVWRLTTYQNSYLVVITGGGALHILVANCKECKHQCVLTEQKCVIMLNVNK